MIDQFNAPDNCADTRSLRSINNACMFHSFGVKFQKIIILGKNHSSFFEGEFQMNFIIYTQQIGFFTREYINSS